MELKFKEAYISGKIEFEDIDQYIEQWNESGESCTLREFLGLNVEEEDIWIEQSDDALKELLDSQIDKSL